MALTDTFIRQTKYSGKPPGDKHSDGGGLHIFVQPSGTYWRLSYRFDGKQKSLSLGVYPAVSLAAPRKLREQAREQLAAGEDPGAIKKATREESKRVASETFEAIGRLWLEKTSARRGPKTQSRVRS